MELAVPKVGSAPNWDTLETTAKPMVVAATATVSSASTNICRRHSRRNSRQAQRTTARRAGAPPSPVAGAGPAVPARPCS